ncbi:hypothetical protein PENTCL1PPCAC_12243, partial [Pristionchus entomophagus]
FSLNLSALIFIFLLSTAPFAYTAVLPTCSGIDDGFIGEGCSRLFWYCREGMAERNRCPEYTRFDIETEMCLFGSYIRACGGDPSLRPTGRPTKRRAESP